MESQPQNPEFRNIILKTFIHVHIKGSPVWAILIEGLMRTFMFNYFEFGPAVLKEISINYFSTFSSNALELSISI